MPSYDVVPPVEKPHSALLGRAIHKAGGETIPLRPVGGPIVHKASSGLMQPCLLVLVLELGQRPNCWKAG